MKIGPTEIQTASKAEVVPQKKKRQPSMLWDRVAAMKTSSVFMPDKQL